ncbi:MAG: hypothetical protein HY703_08730, partial [Gemmatimonadetes bacterium]|nr:hypothetical protein [Gemmatimonadota bacterium]
RWALALADGFWQWSFREGAGRVTYQRLWAAVAGWLVQERPLAEGGALRPTRRVAARGEQLRWVAAGLAADSLAVRIRTEKGEAVLDTTVVAVRGDTAATRVLPPGHYRYEVRALRGGREAARSAGPLTVESYSPEFARPAARLEQLARGTAAAARGVDACGAGGRPLHATAWPYLLLVLLVTTEWVLRRRWGLR